MSQYRLKLDVPVSFAVEPGHQRDVNSPDFRAKPGSMVNTWRDDLTGLVMLLPSHQARNYSDTFTPLAGFRVASNYWREVKRSQDQAQMLANLPIKPTDIALIQINIQATLLAVDAVVGVYDALVWGAETLAPLIHDMAFCWHYNTITDQMLRKNNWFALQWDNIYIHFSHRGQVRVYKYNDRADLVNGGAQLIDDFQICSPGDLLGKDGYFWFIPIPSYGLAIYHSHSPQKGAMFESSVGKGSLRGHLVPWQTRTLPDGTLRLFETSLLRLAINPFQPNVLGYQQVVYPASGTYTDETFDPGYKPTVAPSSIYAQTIPGVIQTATAALQKPDNTGAWAAGTDRQGCVQLSLTTTDGRYTPFVAAYHVGWDPILATRATTALTVPMASNTTSPDKCLRLEWSEDEMARIEGTADIVLGSAAGLAIADRGDSTFTLEKSDDGGTTWTIIVGGFAKDWDVKPVGGMGGFYYHCTVALKDINERFHENKRSMPHAYDGQTVADALNALLMASGFTPMNLATVPTYAKQVNLPPLPESGGTYRFAPRVGDEASEIATKLLSFLHTQGVEWRLRFNWPTQVWVIEQKPHNKSTGVIWQISPFSADANAAAQIWYYGADLGYRPESPEGNIIVVIGLTRPDTAGAGLASDPIYNKPSISTPSSPDYMGRAVGATYFFPPAGDIGELNRMARRMYDAAAHRRQKATVPIPAKQDALAPNLHVQILRPVPGGGTTVWIDGWIKRKTTIVDQFDRESVKLDVDSVWEAEIKR